MNEYALEPKTVAAVALAVAAGCALFRSSQVFVGLQRMMAKRRERIRWDVGMIAAFPEPFLLAAAAIWLYFASDAPDTPLPALRATAGAALTLAGIAVFVWSLLSYRGVGTGHYVDEGHRLSTQGAYALVRHPLYLAALMEWFGLALAFGSVATLAVAALYVVPTYVLYAWLEERMMLDVFGDEYRAYRKRVPMLVPWTRAP